MRLLGLTAAVLLVGASIFMSIRIWGQGQTYQPFENAFFAERTNENLPLIIAPWEQNFLLEKNSNLILWADVYRGESDQILVKPWVDRGRTKKEMPAKPDPARPLLKDLLLQFPNARFVVNCNDNVDSIHLQLVKIIEESKAENRIFVQSDYGTILTTMKEMKPLMVFGSTMGDLTRLKTFDSLFLLPSAPFKGDAFFSTLTYRKRDTLNLEITNELHHRFKKIILGPLKTKDEVEKALALGADALFLEDPFLAPQLQNNPTQ